MMLYEIKPKPEDINPDLIFDSEWDADKWLDHYEMDDHNTGHYRVVQWENKWYIIHIAGMKEEIYYSIYDDSSSKFWWDSYGKYCNTLI